MPHWKYKSILQRWMGRLPHSHYWNALFQTWVTGSIKLTAQRTEEKLIDCSDHLASYRQLAANPRNDFSVLDLGTGWSVVVPLAFYLCGARNVWTFDIAPLLTAARIQRSVERILEFADHGSLQRLLPVLPERVEHLRQLASNRKLHKPREQLESLGIHVVVRDARQTNLPDRSIDLIVSVATVNHISEPILLEVFREFRRVITPEGLMNHHLELADLFWFFDRSITPYHYLRYSEEQWARLDNAVTPQNRLRMPDYRRLFQQAGFEMVREENTLGNTDDLARIPLDARYQNMAREEIQIIYSRCSQRPV